MTQDLNGGVLDVHPSANVREATFSFLGGGCRVVVGPKCVIRGVWGLKADGCVLTFGEGTKVNGKPMAFMNEPGDEITFGEGCLIATCRFRTSDVHPIYDRDTGGRVNPSAPIRVGARVWIAEDAFILKGAVIGDGAIIGAQSVVTASCEIPPYTMAVGQPARVVRRNVEWRHTTKEFFVRTPDTPQT